MIRINRLRFAAPRIVALLAVGFALLEVESGCGSDKPASLSVPMTWKATEHLDMATMAGWTPESSVFVAPVVDKRTNKKDQIGENLEDQEKGITRPITPEGGVCEFVHDALRTQFEQAGIKVVDSQAAADRVVTTELLNFWVEETGTYKSDVRATVGVSNKAGQQLWKGTVNGGTSKWGKSLSGENYREAFSDATLKMIQSVVSNPGFRKAMDKNAMPGATPAAAQPATPAPGSLVAPIPPPASNQPAPAPAPGATGETGTGGNPLARPATPAPAPAPAENK